jgi:hypothetical protein
MENPLRIVTEVLERLSIPYLIGGSHASSARSIAYRDTQDVDIVAAISEPQTDGIVAELGKDWYADAGQIRDAIARGRSFNLIHIPSAEKFDIFPARGEFELTQLQRATPEPLQFGGESVISKVATAEDILLAKLRWYKDGGENSERQWRDIEAIVAANPSMEMDYLVRWAASLGVTGLLTRALSMKS